MFDIQKQLLRVVPFKLKKEFCGNELDNMIEKEKLYLKNRLEVVYSDHTKE